jgi:hypothetical protein
MLWQTYHVSNATLPGPTQLVTILRLCLVQTFWLAGMLSAFQLYVCRTVARVLSEAGITTQEATSLLQKGMEELSSTTVEPCEVPADRETCTGQVEVESALPGVTQQVLRDACMMAANSGGRGRGGAGHSRVSNPRTNAQRHVSSLTPATVAACSPDSGVVGISACGC